MKISPYYRNPSRQFLQNLVKFISFFSRVIQLATSEFLWAAFNCHMVISWAFESSSFTFFSVNLQFSYSLKTHLKKSKPCQPCVHQNLRSLLTLLVSPRRGYAIIMHCPLKWPFCISEFIGNSPTSMT